MLSTGGWGVREGEGEGEGEGVSICMVERTVKEKEGVGVGVTITSTIDVVSNVPELTRTGEEAMMVVTGVGLLVRNILEASDVGITLVGRAINNDGGLLDGGTSIVVISIAKHV